MLTIYLDHTPFSHTQSHTHTDTQLAAQHHCSLVAVTAHVHRLNFSSPPLISLGHVQAQFVIPRPLSLPPGF